MSVSQQSQIRGDRAGFDRSMVHLIRAKRKLHKKRKRVFKHFSNLTPAQELLKETIQRNSAKLERINRGIIVRQHHTDQTQMGLMKEQRAG